MPEGEQHTAHGSCVTSCSDDGGGGSDNKRLFVQAPILNCTTRGGVTVTASTTQSKGLTLKNFTTRPKERSYVTNQTSKNTSNP